MANYKKNVKDFKVFIDFDGTISINDLTDEIFKQNGDFDYHIKRFLNKEITIFEYWNEFTKILPIDLDSYLKEFLKNQEIDVYFEPFVRFCIDNSIQVAIVTDNFDYIVKYVWKYYNLPTVDIFSNHLIFNNGWQAVFPLANENCGFHSALCKRNVIINNTSDDDIVVYIGDGFSDYQASEVSDIIFAKNHLAKYCAENRIPHHNWKTFFDVKRIFEQYVAEGNSRKRHQATLHRKWILEQE